MLFRSGAVANDAIRAVAVRADAKGLKLGCTLDPAAAGWYLGDPTRLRQVLINLLGNAVKFTDAGSVAIDVARTAEGRLAFAVRDTGIGIAPEHAARLFEKFTQADQSITRRFGGTGLGLAIAQEFVTMMGGRIEIDSRPNRGSVFRFAIDLAPTQAPGEAEQASASQAPLRGRAVLMAEDDETNRFAGSELLRRCGAEFDTAWDGQEAVVKALAKKYDLILMDMQMPRLDGLSAARRLRAAPGPNQHTPIVALTANAFTDDVAQCMAAGMDAHMAKPLRRRAVEEELVRFLPPASTDHQPKVAASAAPYAPKRASMEFSS